MVLDFQIVLPFAEKQMFQLLDNLKILNFVFEKYYYYKIPKKYKEYEEFESDFNNSAFHGYSSTYYENLPKGK